MSTTATGKTARYLACLRLGTHKGARRVWLQGNRLQATGFLKGARYSARTTAGVLRIRLSATGDHKVSHKPSGAPVIDLLTRGLGDIDLVEVRFYRGEITVTVDPTDPRARLVRLNARLAAGQPVRLGSLSHGGGVASEAILRGLKAAGHKAQLSFANDISNDYLDQARAHNPAWSASTLAVEADLGDINPASLPECDVLEGGLPCVAASRAGRSKKHLGRPEEDVQVADLAAAFCEVIRVLQPAAIVLENVPEYADSASADLIRRRLGRWGYVIHERVLDGAEWSLEARSRWIMVATTRGLDIDLDALVGVREHTSLGEVLDKRTPAEDWHTFAHLDRKSARDAAKGNKFQQRLLSASSTSVPTLRRGYQKGGSTDPRLAHPTRPGLSRLLSPAEHARIKGIPAQLIKGLPKTTAHEILGQSVISPAFAALGSLVGAALA